MIENPTPKVTARVITIASESDKPSSSSLFDVVDVVVEVHTESLY